jgi:hypothetical protein
MKYYIKQKLRESLLKEDENLTNILKEFDYESELFADPSALHTTPYAFKQLISKEEPNTDDENKFIKALERYTHDESNSLSPSGLKDLLKLKSKFPKILDPRTSSDADGYAYRGTQIDIDILLNSNIKQIQDGSKWAYVIDNPNVTLKSGKSGGYLSFSLSKPVAAGFSRRAFDGQTDKLVSRNMFPVVLEIDLNHPKLIFSPNFINTVTKFREAETLLISKVVKPRRIFITADVRLLRYNLSPRTMSDSEKVKYSKYLELKQKLPYYDDWSYL